MRDTTYTYNKRSWLVGVDGNLDFNTGGSALDQEVHLFYRYDQVGNRVAVGTIQNGVSNPRYYTYDGNHRMTFAYDGEKNETVEAVGYDGHGNRVSESRGTTTIAYTYDAGNRLLNNSSGDQWAYDPLGNQTYTRAANGDTTTTHYDAENRAIRVDSTTKDGTTKTAIAHDDAGNVGFNRIRGKKHGFDELVYLDVRYTDQRRVVSNSYAKGAKGLKGSTTFTYNANGELTFLDRGAKKSRKPHQVASFDYDTDGHIISRANKPTAQTNAQHFLAYNDDPDSTYTEYEGASLSLRGFSQAIQFGASLTKATELKSYLYALGHPIAEAKTEHKLELVTLSLNTGTAAYDDNGALIGYDITLDASDIATHADGAINRDQTARNLATRLYDGFTTLSETAKGRVITYIKDHLPAADAALTPGTPVRLHGYLELLDGEYQNTTLVTDMSFRQLNNDHGPLGYIATHTVGGNDTLQSLAAGYYGSSAYWYLIAEANGLTGNETLKEGTTLKIPNAVANSLNDKDTYSVYDENTIIGTKSPEIRVRKKKRSFFQKLISVVIVIIQVVAAFTAASIGAAAVNLFGPIGIIIGAAMGYVMGLQTSIMTQGLALLAGLQEDFDWKQAKEMGKNFAIAAAVGGIGQWATTAAKSAAAAGKAAAAVGDAAAVSNNYYAQIGYQIAGEVGKQLIQHGEINNWSGVALGLIPGGAQFGQGAWGQTLGFIDNNRKTLGAGLALLEQSRKTDFNTLDWVNAAAGSIIETNPELGVVGQAAVLGIGSLIVGSKYGEDAALNFLGQSIGNQLTGQSSGGLQDLLTGTAKGIGNLLPPPQRNEPTVTTYPLGPQPVIVGEPLPPTPRANEYMMNAQGQLVDAQGRVAPVMLAGGLPASDVAGASGLGTLGLKVGTPSTDRPMTAAEFERYAEAQFALQDLADKGAISYDRLAAIAGRSDFTQLALTQAGRIDAYNKMGLGIVVDQSGTVAASTGGSISITQDAQGRVFASRSASDVRSPEQEMKHREELFDLVAKVNFGEGNERLTPKQTTQLKDFAMTDFGAAMFSRIADQTIEGVNKGYFETLVPKGQELTNQTLSQVLTGQLSRSGEFPPFEDIPITDQRFRFVGAQGYGATASPGRIVLGDKGFKPFFQVGGQAVVPEAILMHEFGHTRFGDRNSGENIYGEKRTVINFENPVRFLLGAEPRNSYYRARSNETISILTNEAPRPGKWKIDSKTGQWTRVR